MSEGHSGCLAPDPAGGYPKKIQFSAIDVSPRFDRWMMSLSTVENLSSVANHFPNDHEFCGDELPSRRFSKDSKSAILKQPKRRSSDVILCLEPPEKAKCRSRPTIDRWLLLRFSLFYHPP